MKRVVSPQHDSPRSHATATPLLVPRGLPLSFRGLPFQTMTPLLVAALLVLMSQKQAHATAVTEGGPVPVALEGPIPVTVKLGHLADAEWKGWGTSLAWFANFIGGLPQGQLNIVLDMLFSKTSGLGFTLVRYNIPGGLHSAYSPRLAQLPFQAVPGFRPNQTKPYDWTADTAQRTVLRGAITRGVQEVEGISYSPPWWMLYSKDVSGRPKGLPNLLPEYFDAFANYLADVVYHYAEVWGITISSLATVNEPLELWWTGNGSFWQEGCAFSMEGISQIYSLTRKALDRRGLSAVNLTGIDDWGWQVVAAFNRTSVLPSLVSRISYHAYQQPLNVYKDAAGPAVELQHVGQIARALKKELWQSEWGPLHPDIPNPTDLELALLQAKSIALNINTARPTAFLYWQPVAPTSDYFPPPFTPSYGLIRLHYNYSLPFNPIRTRQYWCQFQLSKAFPPGTRFFRLQPKYHSFALAGYHKPTQRLSITFTNRVNSSVLVKLGMMSQLGQVTNLSDRGTRTVVFRTSQAELLKVVFNGYVRKSLSGLPGLMLSPLSVTTVIFGHMLVT